VANGVFKAFCFALIIGAFPAIRGWRRSAGPRGIGRSGREAVVELHRADRDL